MQGNRGKLMWASFLTLITAGSETRLLSAYPVRVDYGGRDTGVCSRRKSGHVSVSLLGDVLLRRGQRAVRNRDKPGIDSRQVIARFEAERQALSMMDHINIDRVLDAGTTSGEPGGVTPSSSKRPSSSTGI